MGSRRDRMFVAATAALMLLTGTAIASLTRGYDFTEDVLHFSQDTINDTIYDVVEIPGYNLDYDNIGAPQLPLRAVHFAIPGNQELDSVSVSVGQVDTLEGTYYMRPAQPPACSSEFFFPPLRCYYENGFPCTHVDGLVESYSSNHRIASVNLRPVIYLPGGKLVKAQNITVTVHVGSDYVEYGGLVPRRRSFFCYEQDTSVVRGLVENPEDVDNYSVPVPLEEPHSPLEISDRPSEDGSPVDCILIAEDAAVPFYQRYVDFWTERGVVTTARPLDWICEQYPAFDKAASIRAFVTEAYEHWGTGFVVMAGWQSGVPEPLGLPTRVVPCFGGEEPRDSMTTDHYFIDLEGTWDENLNHKYGERFVEPGVSSMYFVDSDMGFGTALCEPRYGSPGFGTVDGGENWEVSQDHEMPYPVVIHDMYFVDSDYGWCVGEAGDGSPSIGGVFKTVDGGKNWEISGPGIVTKVLTSVHFVDRNIGWTVSRDGRILHTTDGGETWTLNSVHDEPLYDVEFNSEGTHGWVAIYRTDEPPVDPAVLHTTNSGVVWTLLELPLPSDGSAWVYGVGFMNELEGWAVGSASGTSDLVGCVWHTTDGGTYWDVQILTGSTTAYDIQAKEGGGVNLAWLVTSQDVWTYFDQGETGVWFRTAVHAGLEHVCFVDQLEGWCAGPASHVLLHSIDGGLSWEEKPFGFLGDESVAEVMPELRIGRLPTVAGCGEENTLLDKLLGYEADPPPGYLMDAKFFVEGHTWPLHEALWSQPWYDYNNDAYLTFGRQDMVDALTDGFGLACHWWHAGRTHWKGTDGSSLDATALIENGARTGIAFTGGCHGLCLFGDEALGRHFLVNPLGGSVAYGGTSVSNCGFRSLHLAFIPHVRHGRKHRLGVAYKLATDDKRGADWFRITENLLGDPLMDIWTTADPEPLSASHPTTFTPEPGEFEVAVTCGEAPVPCAVVCLAMKTAGTEVYSVYHVLKADENGRALFNIDPKETGEMVVTATKHDYLPYKGTCPVGLFTDNPLATANNQQRNLVRIAGTDIMHLVYTSQGMIMHTVSWNGGSTWLRPEPVDCGEYPALALNYGTMLCAIEDEADVMRDAPWIVYKQDDDIKVALLREGQPPVIQTLFDGYAPYLVPGPPAIVAGPLPSTIDPYAWATYAVTSGGGATESYYMHAQRFTEFYVDLPYILDEQIGYECSSPSIAITPGDIVHAVWQREVSSPNSTVVLYSENRLGTWSQPVPVQHEHSQAHNPFTEAYGDSVFAAWADPFEQAEVYNAARALNDPPYWWTGPRLKSASPLDHSDRPVMATREATVWQEFMGTQSEVYINIKDEIHSISSTAGNSAYPSIDVKLYENVARIDVNTVWTEEVLPGELYEVRFEKFVWMPTDGPGQDYPAYLAVQTGDSTASSYCRHRDGPSRIGPYALDYGSDSLKYLLPYLDPVYDYYARAIVYHEGRNRWTQSIQFDDSLSALLHFDPGKPETLWVQVPVEAYRYGDAEAVLAALRLRGQFSVMTDFTLHQCEPRRMRRRKEGGGGMDAGIPLRVVLAPSVPNPFARGVKLRFSLNRPGKVSLRIYDASGRLVQTLLDCECPAGSHSAVWDGSSTGGRLSGNGVYFARLQTGNKTQVRKLVLSR